MPFSRTRGVCWIASLLLAVWGTTGHAAGLGSITVQSGFGQPLRAVVSLIGASDDDPDVHCIRARISSIDGSILMTPRVGLVRSGSAAIIHISTTRGVNELALNISVAIGCDISVQRTYQVLIDPAVVLPSVEESQEQAIVTTESHRASLPAATFASNTSGGTSTRHSAASGSRTRHRETASNRESNVDSADIPEQRKAKPRHKTSTHGSRSVLKMSGLDTPIEELLSEPGLKMSDQLSGGAEADPQKLAEIKQAQAKFAAYLRGEDPAQTAEDRLKAAKAEVEKLSAAVARDNVQRRADLAALESTQTESHRWIRSLQVLLGFCLLALAWLMWRFYAIKRDETYTSWRDLLGEHQNTDSRLGENSSFNTSTFGSFDTGTSTFGTGVFSTTNSEFNTFDPNTTAPPAAMQPGKAPQSKREPAPAEETHKTMRGVPLAQKPEAASGNSKPAPFKYDSNARVPFTRYQQTETRNHNPDSYMKVEEISDVMELANVWMALHDPQKVLELLEPFSGVEQPESPLPWLCLLDVYHSIGDREKYEAILARIKKIYNVRLAPWNAEADDEPPKTLADFPHIVDTVLNLWEGDEIVPYLDKLMKDDREGSRQGFDLPVYRDIIRLLTLAKDTSKSRKREDAEQAIAEAISTASQRAQAVIDTAARAKIAAPSKEPAAAEASAPERKPQLRERPKYITTSYQRNLRTRADAGEQKQPDAASAFSAANYQAAQDASVGIADTGETATETQTAQAETKSEYDSMSPMAIKLHLAIAYVDIGDKEGAQLLLEEVIHGGNAEQVEQAKSLLATLR